MQRSRRFAVTRWQIRAERNQSAQILLILT
jgi:hypothetical protein